MSDGQRGPHAVQWELELRQQHTGGGNRFRDTPDILGAQSPIRPWSDEDLFLATFPDRDERHAGRTVTDSPDMSRVDAFTLQP
jgi:hypothetical protein